jgi:primary-amine oxidase
MLLLQIEGVQPTTTPDDCNLAEHIIMADPRIRQLLATRYGITDPDLMVFDPWSLHGTPEQYKGRRLMQVGGRGAAAAGCLVCCSAGMRCSW